MKKIKQYNRDDKALTVAGYQKSNSLRCSAKNNFCSYFHNNVAKLPSWLITYNVFYRYFLVAAVKYLGLFIGRSV